MEYLVRAYHANSKVLTVLFVCNQNELISEIKDWLEVENVEIKEEFLSGGDYEIRVCELDEINHLTLSD